MILNEHMGMNERYVFQERFVLAVHQREQVFCSSKLVLRTANDSFVPRFQIGDVARN